MISFTEDLSSLDNNVSGSNPSTPGTPSEKKYPSKEQLHANGKIIKKRSGLLGIFGQNKNVTGMSPIAQEDFFELPPNQPRKKLQAKIDELTGKIFRTAARDGLMKMKTVYEANPALGTRCQYRAIDRERTQAGQAQGGLQTVPGLARGG